MKRNTEKKINIWLVWEVDRLNGEANIRAIDTNPKIAQKHLDGLVKCNDELSHRPIRFYIEPTMTDHLFGWKTLDRVLHNPDELGCKIKKEAKLKC